MTTGEMMVYSGIGLVVIGILAIVLCVPLFGCQRKKLEEKVKEEYM